MTLLALVSAALLAPPSPESPVKNEPFRQVLTDLDRNLRIAEWSVSSDDVSPGSAAKWRVEKDVLRGGRQEGVDRIRVDNGVLSFTVLPTRGMNLWDGRCGDVRLGWDSPVKEAVHPLYVHLGDRGGLGWLEGFAEWMNRCGLASNGAPGEDLVPNNTGKPVPMQLTLHGKVSYLPARHVEVAVEPGEKPVIRVRGVVDETMMYGTQLRLVTEISTVAGSKTVTVHDEIQNLGAAPQEFQILYHTNFGPPLLGAGSEVVAPALRVTPRDARGAEGDIAAWSKYLAPTPGYTEQVYFLGLAADSSGRTEVLLKGPKGDRGASVEFSTRELPCLTVWKNTAPLASGYVTGIEPATNFPNNRSFERKHGRVPRLAGGESFHATFSITAHTDEASVRAAQDRIAKLLGGQKAKLDAQPAPDLCP